MLISYFYYREPKQNNTAFTLKLFTQFIIKLEDPIYCLTFAYIQYISTIHTYIHYPGYIRVVQFSQKE